MSFTDLTASESAVPDLPLPSPEQWPILMVGQIGRSQKNKGESDLSVGAARLKLLLPFALARLGREYEMADRESGAVTRVSGPLPLRPKLPELSAALGCGGDFIFELVNRIVAIGPENVRASDMLKKPQGGGKGTSRLGDSADTALDAAIWSACVDRGLAPGSLAANKAVRTHMIANGYSGRLPATGTIRHRSRSARIISARTDAYERDHLNRVCGSPDSLNGLMSMLQLDTTQFTSKDDALLVVDAKGRVAGVANVIFGILPANRGIWTWLPLVGAANSFLAGLSIKRGLCSKAPLLRELKVDGILPFHGKPAEIRHDGGSEFVADHLKRVMQDFGILIDECGPAGTPHYRGFLERFNRTAHLLFSQFLESEIGKRYLRPVLSRPGAKGILLADLDRALAEWIVSDYHIRRHKGLAGDTPISRFEKLVVGANGLPASGLPLPLNETPKMEWDLMCEEMRVVNHLGISLNNRRYACPDLARLFVPGKRSSVRRMPVRYHPYGMGKVSIQIPDERGELQIVPVPWVPENDKFALDEEDRQASINPSCWEWDALFDAARYAGQSKPAGGVIEELHAEKEKEAAEGTRRHGAPKTRARIAETRNREMRNFYGADNSSVTVKTALSATSDAPQPPGIPAPPKDSPPAKPRGHLTYLSVRGGADAY